MTVLTIIAAVILGALWRRWFGGWPKVIADRWPKLLAALLIGFLAMWPSLPWYVALPVSGALCAFWIPHHDLTNWKLGDWLLRYGPFGVIYWIAQRFPIKAINNAIDGSFALAEFAIGGAVYGTAAAVAFLIT